MCESKNKSFINILTTAALALPGIRAMADGVPEAVRSELNYTYYSEGHLGMAVEAYQAKFDIPVTDAWQLTVQTTRDVMTGASFVFFAPKSIYTQIPTDSGTLVAISSGASTGASINDKREEVEVNSTYYFPESVFSVGVGYSTEHDYQSLFSNIEWRKPIKSKSTELMLGLGFATDKNKPVAGYDVPFRLAKESPEAYGNLSTLQAIIGLRQDISKKSTMQIILGNTFARGYLANPYEHIVIYGNATAIRPGSVYLPAIMVPGSPAGITADFDRRPDEKSEYTLMLRTIWYIEKYKGSLHFDYRLARNNWNITSNMFEASYYQPFAKKWEIAPTIRFYSQSQAWFYYPAFYYVPNSPFPSKSLPGTLAGSADYRLAKFGALSTQLEITKNISSLLRLSLLGGINQRKECYYLGSEPDFSHPYNNRTARYVSLNALIDFNRIKTIKLDPNTEPQEVASDTKESAKPEETKSEATENADNSKTASHEIHVIPQPIRHVYIPPENVESIKIENIKVKASFTFPWNDIMKSNSMIN